MFEENCRLGINFVESRVPKNVRYPRLHEFVLFFWKATSVYDILRQNGFVLYDPDSRRRRKTLVTVSMNYNPHGHLRIPR